MADLAGLYDKLLNSETLAYLAAELENMLRTKGRAGEKRLLELREDALALKQDLIALSIKEEKLQKGSGHRVLLAALEHAWDLPDARHRLWETASRIEKLLEQAQAVHQAKAQFFMTRIVSAAGLFVFVHELIGALANAYTMNEYERLMVIAGKLGASPSKLAEIQSNAGLSDLFDWSAIAAWVVIFVGAMAYAGIQYYGSQRVPRLPRPRRLHGISGGVAAQNSVNSHLAEDRLK
jgi:hypothetical protein